jgi:hypothetical protein
MCILHETSCQCSSQCVHHVHKDGHNKILSHTQTTFFIISDQKIYFAIGLATKTFWSPFLWFVIVALPFTLKNILRKKKNYANSKISPCKNIILKENHLKKTKFLQDITTLSLIPSFNTSQNTIF